MEAGELEAGDVPPVEPGELEAGDVPQVEPALPVSSAAPVARAARLYLPPGGGGP